MSVPADISQFRIGDQRSLSIDVTENLVAKFVELTGD